MKSQLIKLLSRKWVTPVVALNEVGCFSLSQLCGEMRAEGMNVLDKWVKLPSGKRVKAYRIV